MAGQFTSTPDYDARLQRDFDLEMAGKTNTVIVDRDLENLLPEYLKNREEELKLLRTALDQKNFDELRQRGHRMKGVGSPYGFDKVTMLGKLIEDNALAIDIAKLENLISDYADFLGNLNIVYE